MNLWARRQGFTIVELLIVVVVIAILAAIVIIAYNGIQDRARQSAAQTSLSSANTKVQAYKIENSGALPADLASLGITDTDSVTYQYTRNDQFEPNTYCMTTTSGKYSSHIASNGVKTDGPCPGHTGEAPALLNCAAGYVTVPGNSLFGTQAFCAMKYEAKDSGGTAVSTVSGTPWVSMNQGTARTKSSEACAKCHLMTLNEWLTIAHNALNVPSNWSGGAVGSGAVFGGHNDGTPAAGLAASSNDTDAYNGTGQTSGNQRRTLTLSNGEVIWDFVGNVWEWVDEQTPAKVGTQPGIASDTVDNFVYKQWDVSGLTYGDYARTAPGYGSKLAAENNWRSTQGMGELITSSAQDDARGFIMGGAYTTGYVNSGLFTLRLNYKPEQASSTTGFRASYTP